MKIRSDFVSNSSSSSFIIPNNEETKNISKEMVLEFLKELCPAHELYHPKDVIEKNHKKYPEGNVFRIDENDLIFDFNRDIEIYDKSDDGSWVIPAIKELFSYENPNSNFWEKEKIIIYFRENTIYNFLSGYDWHCSDILEFIVTNFCIKYKISPKNFILYKHIE